MRTTGGGRRATRVAQPGQTGLADGHLPKDCSDCGRNGVDRPRSQLFDNPTHATDTLLSAEQLATELGVSVKTIRKWRFERFLPADCMLKLRQQVRYRRERVLRWLETQEG